MGVCGASASRTRTPSSSGCTIRACRALTSIPPTRRGRNITPSCISSRKPSEALPWATTCLPSPRAARRWRWRATPAMPPPRQAHPAAQPRKSQQAGGVCHLHADLLPGRRARDDRASPGAAGRVRVRAVCPTIYWQEFSATSSTHPASPSPSTMDPPPPTRRCCINPIAMILCRRTLASMTSRTCKSPADRGRSSIAAVPISCQAHRRD